MKQLTYEKKNTLKWWDVDEPKLESPEDVIVRPIAAARCDGDKVFLFNDVTRLLQAGVAIHYIDPIAKKLFGNKPFNPPIPIGHECVGEVVSMGENVKKYKQGDKVIVPWAISCGDCGNCLSGLTTRCEEAGDTLISGFGFGESLGPWGGMVSDLIRVPHAEYMLVGVPNGIDPAALASASDNIPDGWRTVGPQLMKKPGAHVLVLGGSAASIGLYAAGVAIALGASQVDYIVYDIERLEIAMSLGANVIPIEKKSRGKWYRQNAPALGGKYPIVADCCMHEDGLRFGIRSLAPGGICTSVGYYFKKGTSLPMMQMYANDSTFHTGISHPRATLNDVLKIIESGEFQPEKITTVLANWEDADQAFLEKTTKVVVYRPSIYTK
ncbi:MAG: alcohol dehydrogenase catalytic domain-containing protein [Reichenbachiella sp.]